MNKFSLLRAGTLKRLHVNRHVMAANKRDGTDLPALTVQTSAGPLRARAVEVLGPSRLVQSGARAWLETRAEVVIA